MFDRAAFEGALMGEDAGAGPVRALAGIGEGLAFFHHCHRELMGEVRVAASVARALREAEMRALVVVINALRGIVADGFRE